MRLGFITENMQKKLRDAYFNRLVERVGQIPNHTFEPQHYIASLASGSSPSPRGWFAKMVNTEFPDLNVDIGVDSGNGIVVAKRGIARSWTELKSMLTKVAQRFDARAAKGGGAAMSARAGYKAIHDFLAPLWDRPVQGLVLSLDDRHEHGLTRGYVAKKNAQHKSVLSFNCRLTAGIVQPISSVTATFNGTFGGDQYPQYPATPRANFSIADLKALFEACQLPYEQAAQQPSFRLVMLKTDDPPLAEGNKWANREMWTILHGIATGVLGTNGPLPEKMYDNSKQSVTAQQIPDTPLIAHIRKTFSSFAHISHNYCFGDLKNTPYGPVRWHMRVLPNAVHLTIDGPRQQRFVDRNVPIADIEQITDGSEFIIDQLDNQFAESIECDSPVLLESDIIDDDFAEMLKEILSPLLQNHPDIVVKRGHGVLGRQHYQIAQLVHPVAGTMYVALRDGGRMMVRAGGRFNSWRDVENEEQLTDFFNEWAAHQPRPSRPRRPRQPRQYEQPPQAAKQAQSMDVDKSEFFPRVAYHLNNGIPGRQVSSGKPFTLAIHAKNVDFPPEIFSTMNLHRVGVTRDATKPGFIGWIGGSIDAEKKAMYIDEVQSDLMQRTIEMTNQERFNASIANDLNKSKGELRDLRREMARLRKFATVAPASERFRLEELLTAKDEEIGALEAKVARRFKLSNYSQFKSKIENTFKHWINAFYHTAFNRARQLGLTDIFIISSERLGQIWGKAQGKSDDDASVFARAYNRVAQHLGAERQGDWWHIKLDKIPFKESLDIKRVANTISDHILYESMDGDTIRRWLGHAGINVHDIKGHFPDGDFDRLNLVVTRVNQDGSISMTQELNELDSDSLQRSLSHIQNDQFDVPVDASEYELEELERDATLLITAHKIIDGVPYGIAIYTIDRPGETFNSYDAEEPSEFDDVSDEELFGIDSDRLDDLWNN